jgi:hypothetical protein
MKAFLDWVLARRYRLILLAMVFAPLFPVATAALLALETARRGVNRGLSSAALGTAGMVLLSLPAGADLVLSAAFGAITFFSGVAIGALLQRAGNLTLAFQAAILFALLLVAAVTLLGPNPRQLFDPVITELTEILRASGATSQEVAAVESWGGILLTAAVFSQIVGPLLLGYWWLAIASGQKVFGREFRALKLGRTLGVAATAVIALGLVFDAPLVQNLTALALSGCVVQGFAVLHAWAHARRWHVGVIIPVYVLLVTPLMILVLLALGGLGLVDNWFDLRARLQAQA